MCHTFHLLLSLWVLICLNLLSSSDLKLALLLGLWVQRYVFESMIRALDTLFYVLFCVVSVTHLLFSKSSGFYSIVFQVRFFTKFPSRLVEVGYCGSSILHFASYMLWSFKLAQKFAFRCIVVFEEFEKSERKTFYAFAYSCT